MLSSQQSLASGQHGEVFRYGLSMLAESIEYGGQIHAVGQGLRVLGTEQSFLDTEDRAMFG